MPSASHAQFDLLPVGEQCPYFPWQPVGRAQLRAAFLPPVEIVGQGDAAAPRPAVQGSKVGNRVRIILQQAEHGRHRPLGVVETAVRFEEYVMGGEPGREAGRHALGQRRGPIAGEEGFPVVSDGRGIGGIVRERGGCAPTRRPCAPSPRRVKASASASSSHWQGLRGLALRSQLLCRAHVPVRVRTDRQGCTSRGCRR